MDSFCIVQDDDKHKSEQINAMNSIYGNSLFTIIAISSGDANTGLPGVRPNTRPLRYISIDEKHALVATTDHLGSVLETSTYETRGWTFQERLLSPRCLCVLDWQYFFSASPRLAASIDCPMSRWKKIMIHTTPHRTALYGDSRTSRDVCLHK